MFQVENDLDDKEPSSILIRETESGEVLVRLSGPMSFAAAGSFITCMKEQKSDMINVAVAHHI